MQSDPSPTPTTTVADVPPHSDASIPCPQPQPQFLVIPPPVNGGLQMAYPNTTSQPRMPQQLVYPNPIGFPPFPQQPVASYSIPNAIQPAVDMNLLQFANSNPTQIPYWPNPVPQTPQSNSHKRKQKTSQNVRCEICDIFCNSLELYEKHLSGRKHRRTLKRNYPPQTAPSQSTPQPVVNDSTPEKILTTSNVPCNNDKALEDNVATHKDGDQDLSTTALSDNGKDEASSMSVDEGLEAKKRKLPEGKVSEEHVLLCSTDNDPCRNNVTSSDHLSEEKHNIQVATTGTETPIVSPTEDEVLVTKKQKLIQSGVSAQSLRVCTICNIACNSEVAFSDHILGKKHIGLVQKSGAVPPQNLDSKKKKTIPRICTLCNVACNSESVFESHLAGQKHASVVKRMGLTEVQPQPTITG